MAHQSAWRLEAWISESALVNMKVRLCSTHDVPAGTMKRVDIEGSDPFLVVHTSEGLRVLEDTCTHALASLSEGVLEEDMVFCPLHGGAFDTRNGEVLNLPCTVPLKVFAMQIEGTDIFIELARSQDGSAGQGRS